MQFDILREQYYSTKVLFVKYFDVHLNSLRFTSGFQAEGRNLSNLNALSQLVGSKNCLYTALETTLQMRPIMTFYGR